MTTSLAPPAPRYAGLDGLRALAVVLVVVYHLFPASWVRGGFIGVDVFFVISGFLITSLLLRERQGFGRIAIRPFWARRARRLLPALGLLVLVCGTWAALVGGDVLVGLGAQTLGAATFGYNWISILTGGGYFDETTPEVFRNLWSLSVEEQFYVLWPLLLPVILLVRATWLRAGIALLAAAASALWMAALIAPGGDPTRAYFGTDSHAFGILIGIALAFALYSRLDRATSSGRAPTRTARATTTALGILAVAGIIVIACLAPTDSIGTFPGALLAASLLTAVAIACASWRGSPLGSALDIAPLRWIGERSYGIYLWHWPVLVLMMASMTGLGAGVGVPIEVGIWTLALTLVAAAASYRWIEQPIRRLGFRGCATAIKTRLSGTPPMRHVALSLLIVGAVAVGATTTAIASAPAETSSEAAVAAGARALAAAESAQNARTPPHAPKGATAEDPAPAGRVEQDPPRGPRNGPPAPAPSPSPTTIAGDEITAVGDSVMLASAGGLLEMYPGIQIDAEVSRSMWTAPGILESLAGAGQLRPYVVVALGTNGPVDVDALQRILDVVGPDRHLVLVNAFAPRDWIPGVNQTLDDFAASHPGVVVADWSGAITPHQDQLASDLIHPGPTGGSTYARAVATAVQGIEDARAEHEVRIRVAHGTVDEIMDDLFALARQSS